MDGGGEIAGSSDAAAAAEDPPPPTPSAEAAECGWELEMVDEGGVEVEEEAVAEVMKWLEREITMPPGAAAGGSYYQTPGFVTINGNEEMCGPSFSDHSSTVMASIDTREHVGGGGSASYFVGVPPVIPPVPGAGMAPPAPELPVWGEEDDKWLDRMISGGGGGAGLL